MIGIRAACGQTYLSTRIFKIILKSRGRRMRRMGRAVILAAAAMALGIFGMASYEHAGSKATVSQRSEAIADAATEGGGADEPKVYKVGIVQYVDDAP